MMLNLNLSHIIGDAQDQSLHKTAPIRTLRRSYRPLRQVRCLRTPMKIRSHRDRTRVVHHSSRLYPTLGTAKSMTNTACATRAVRAQPSDEQRVRCIGSRNFHLRKRLSRLAHVGVLADHRAAVQGRGHCRLFSGVHPGHRRVRDPVAFGWLKNPDDRQGAVGGVLFQPRLAGRLGRRRHFAAGSGHPDHPFPAQ